MADLTDTTEITEACDRLFDLHHDGDAPRQRSRREVSPATQTRTARPAYAWI